MSVLCCPLTASNILTAWYLLCLCKKVNIAKIKPVLKKGLSSISIFWQLLRCEVILQFSCFAIYIYRVWCLHVFCVSIFTWTSICSMVNECTRLNHGTTQSKEMYHVRAVHWLLLAWGSAEQNCSEKFLHWLESCSWMEGSQCLCLTVHSVWKLRTQRFS